MRLTKTVAGFALLAAAVLAVPLSLAQHDDEHVLQNEKDVKWVDAPPFLPPGAKVAIVKGDPGKKALFAIRVKMPANYQVPAHSHPGDEHVVVLSGALYMGKGDKLDTSAGKALTVGGFAMMPANMNHFAYTKEPTTLLVFGATPLDFNYVNSADDPRKAKKE